MIALAHTLVAEGLHDRAFLERYTVGFDKFLRYLMGEDDGQPKDAAWAARISGIDAETIRQAGAADGRERGPSSPPPGRCSAPTMASSRSG